MEWTNEQLQQLEQFAAQLFTVEELAIIIGVEPVKLQVDFNQKGKAWQVIMKGRLQTESDIRASVLQLAKSGSAPAQAQAIVLLEKLK